METIQTVELSFVTLEVLKRSEMESVPIDCEANDVAKQSHGIVIINC